MRFSCDAMLGGLARWMRFAGLDVHYGAALPDASLAALARAEGRWLLTRDRALAAAAGPRVLLLRGVDTRAQVRELRARLPLEVTADRFFSRCARCNGSLAEVSRAEVAHLVPPYVAAHAPRFRRCTGCGRVYWPGTHAVRIARELQRLFLDEVDATAEPGNVS